MYRGQVGVRVRQLLFVAAIVSIEVGCIRNNVSDHRVGGKAAAEVFADPQLAKLATSACLGDVSGIERAIETGMNPNATGLDGVTPLYWAQNCGNLAGMEALLKAGANPNAPVADRQFTPVDLAAGIPNPEILALLLRYGGDPNAVYERSPWTALRVAFALGMQEKGWENYYNLLNAGADINRVHKNETIAEFAASLNQFDKVMELLERGYTVRVDNLEELVYFADDESIGADQVLWKRRVLSVLKDRGATTRSKGTEPPPAAN